MLIGRGRKRDRPDDAGRAVDDMYAEALPLVEDEELLDAALLRYSLAAMRANRSREGFEVLSGLLPQVSDRVPVEATLLTLGLIDRSTAARAVELARDISPPASLSAPGRRLVGQLARAAAHAGERVHDTLGRPAAGQREVEPLGGAPGAPLRLRRGLERRGQARLERCLRAVRLEPDLAALLGWDLSERAQQLRQLAVATEELDPDLLELAAGPRRLDGGERLALEVFDLRAHG